MATDVPKIELNEHQQRLLASAAENLGVPWHEVFGQAIAPFVEPTTGNDKNGRPETPYEIMLRHGLIGCIEGTPPDLSTNRR
jgi:hypothetical protein